MTTRNILCAYSGEEAGLNTLDYALKIARHHDGWLTGVVHHGQPILETRFAGQLPKEVIDTLHEADAERVREISTVFNREVERAGFAERAEFVEVENISEFALSKFARSFDLIVTGVQTDNTQEAHLAANPDLLALRSGRPVLVIPDEYKSDTLASHAVVAWDGKRSAARAMGDAMPVLEEKAKVTILSVGKEAPEGMDRVLQNLRRHGIDAEAIVKPRHHSVGQTILETVSEMDAQLIVMGAYEHSKFSHDLFGGATTDVMGQAKVPVFMSH